MNALAVKVGPPVALIVDDDADLREALAWSLDASGYEVLLAENGLAALRVLRGCERPPAVILLDVMMPVMGGAEFREAQLRDPALATIPVVVFSGHGDVATKAAELRADAHLAKPVELRDLLRVLSRFTTSEF